MLVIRSEQMQVFEQYMLKSFVQRMIAVFKARTPYTEKELRPLIEAGIDEAFGFGIQSEQEVERYLECVVQFGRGFQSTRWAGPILRDRSLPETPKMDRIQWFVLHDFGGYSA